jgi:hypothetical protein
MDDLLDKRAKERLEAMRKEKEKAIFITEEIGTLAALDRIMEDIEKRANELITQYKQ